MSEGRIKLMDLGYRVAHLVNLIFFVSLIASGSMVFLSDLASWFALAIGEPLSTLQGVESDPVVVGIQWARTWHRIVGFAWGAFLVIYGLYYVLFDRKFHIFKALMKGLRDQFREAAALVRHYIFGQPIPEDVSSKMGRHNVLVGWLFILLLVSVALLSISGVALVYREKLGLTLSDVRLMYALHDLGFVLSLVFLFLHVYASLHPSNRPLLRAMFFHTSEGEVPEDWARKHMGAILREGLKEGEL